MWAKPIIAQKLFEKLNIFTPHHTSPNSYRTPLHFDTTNDICCQTFGTCVPSKFTVERNLSEWRLPYLKIQNKIVLLRFFRNKVVDSSDEYVNNYVQVSFQLFTSKFHNKLDFSVCTSFRPTCKNSKHTCVGLVLIWHGMQNMHLRVWSFDEPKCINCSLTSEWIFYWVPWVAHTFSSYFFLAFRK